MRRPFLNVLPFAFIACGLSACFAADHGPAYVDPEVAAEKDPDFLFQGEYANSDRGVQVIALGDGQFRTVTYPGGLPGAGWTQKERRSREGTRESLASVLEGVERVERQSDTLGLAPPEDAIVLFDGTKETFTQHWRDGASMTVDGLLIQGATTIDEMQDFQLHLEFRLPYMPEARGQARGNSGCYVQGRYEIQMLDSFGLGPKDNECGGIYQASAPKLNMTFPPLTWQTYDIDFQAARFDDAGKKTAPAKVTVRHNGTIIHGNLSLPGNTPGGVMKDESAAPGPLFLQNHGDEVRYRNIWFVPASSEDSDEQQS
ncbi:DUF1080 domain-containing protein [Thalassoglobus sp. JC818]|uniref:3-keto-disaccharide hydrolase n=1 Tax=Thalassoglobus sp. JC818 TaxID=3232136 RepID=UPI0034593785